MDEPTGSHVHRHTPSVGHVPRSTRPTRRAASPHRRTPTVLTSLLAVGEDVAPSLYGGNLTYTGQGPHHPLVDEREGELIRHLVQTETPTLGLCRGAQIINVALGGTLIQHLEVPDHRNPDILIDLCLVTHPVTLEPDSILGRAYAAEPGTAPVITVQSAHHQAIAHPGQGLRIVGHGPHGVIEAIEHATAPLIGVQWHPEDPNTDGADVTVLFQLLLNAPRARSLGHQALGASNAHSASPTISKEVET